MPQIRTRSIRGVMAVSPALALDAASSRDFQATIMELVDRGEQWLAVDLMHAPQITGTVIGALLTVRRKVEARTGCLVLCGLSAAARRALVMVGVAGRFQFAPSLRSGIRQLLVERRIKELADHVAELLVVSENRSDGGDSHPDSTVEVES